MSCRGRGRESGDDRVPLPQLLLSGLSVMSHSQSTAEEPSLPDSLYRYPAGHRSPAATVSPPGLPHTCSGRQDDGESKSSAAAKQKQWAASD
jgi:hypothetical protein